MAASNRVMEQNLAAKLRLTAAALGCSSRKELCQRFHAVNPATICVLDRLHKWLQERALPRSARFYDDWAQVVGSRRPGAWFASCSVEALLAELAMLFDADPEWLVRAETLGRQAAAPRHAGGAGPQRGEAAGLLAGTYACYSYAWSPHYRGNLIRGSLVLTPAPGARTIAASYSEFVGGREFRFRGAATAGSGVVMVPVLEEVSQSQVCLTLITPRPPASVLCGMLSGVTVLDHEPRPSASRLVAVRLPGAEDAGAARGYLPVSAGVLGADLRRCGLRAGVEGWADRSIMAFLDGHEAAHGVSQIASGQAAELVRVFDEAFLAGQAHGSAREAAAD